MDFDLDLGQWIVIILSAILFLWYFAANSFNRRRGVATYRWLYHALEQVGKIAHTEWIGSSNAGARLLVDKAGSPLRKVYVMYLLEPREFLPYWVFSRLRGKRDEVVIRITLRKAPPGALEVRRSKGNSLNPSSRLDGSNLFTYLSFQIMLANADNLDLLDGVKRFLDKYQDTIIALNLQPEDPHFELRTSIKQLLLTSSEDFLEAVIDCIAPASAKEQFYISLYC